jgi:O-antigen/teichoic acid export membrane protein
MSSNQNLAKNTLFFTIALAMQKVLSFVYFILIARAMTVEDLGRFSFALSFAAIFAMLLDIGMSQILIRESARKKEAAQKHLSDIIGIKLVLMGLIYFFVVAVVNIMGYPEITKQMVYVAGVIMIVDSFAWSFYSVLRGLQNLAIESFGVIINQLIILTVGFIVIRLDLGLVILIGVYLIGSLFNLIYSSLFLAIKYGVFPRPRFNYASVKVIFQLSLPFAMAGFFAKIYSYIDIVLLSKLADDTAVGIYSVAYKAAFALQFIGVALSASVYPALCKYFVESKEMLAKTFNRSIFYLMFIAMPLSVGTILVADQVIGPVFGLQYVKAILPLQILMSAMVLIFLAFAIGAMLNAGNRQARHTIHLAIVALFNLVANLILIPMYTYIGAAVAALLSYVLLLILGWSVIGSLVQYDKKYLALSFVRIAVSCVVMGLVVTMVKPYIHVALAIPMGALVYVIAIYLVGGLTKQDINQFKNLLFKTRIKKLCSQ